MRMQTLMRLAVVSVCLTLLLHAFPLIGSHSAASNTQLTFSDSPSAVVIKVGNNATVNLIVMDGENSGQVCFSQQGFPTSGFTLTFIPECESMQYNATGQLIVEATPAAAPQNFTAFVTATLGNVTVSTPLTVTVVPAIPAWIPWLGIFLFFLVIGAALFIRPRKSKSKSKGKMSG